MSRVDFTTEFAREWFDYNPDTGVIGWKKPPGAARRTGNIAGSIYSTGYRMITIKSTRILAHRLAFLCMGKSLPEQVDHINGRKDDNRWCNLRPTNNIDNQRNAKRWSTNTSGVTGVSWIPSRERWRGSIVVSGKVKHLLDSTDFFEAVCARKSAETKYGFHPNHGRR